MTNITIHNILAVIPARGGSKGIPKKNIKLMAGKPLITYSIESAIKSAYINKIIVSTDDIEIEDVAINSGVDVIKRPENLAKDDSPTIETVLHVLKLLKNTSYKPDLIILLQPTSPLRTEEDIDKSIEIFTNNDCKSVISVCEIEHSPYWSFKTENNCLKPLFEEYFEYRRQELPKVFVPNGAIFISSPETLKKFLNFFCDKTFPYLMPVERSVDIDTELDFKIAEFFIENQNK